MTIARYLVWAGYIALWFTVLSAVQIPVRKRGSLPVRVILIIVKFLAGSGIAFLIIATEYPFVYRVGFELAALALVLQADAFGDILSLPAVFRKRQGRAVPRHIELLICAACVLIYAAYGTVNMQIVTAHPITITSDKLTQPHRFVFAADLHTGSSQSMRVTESAIQKINDEDAEFVVLGGDIVDELTTKEEMDRTFQLLGRISAPVYFIYGNHDRQASFASVGKTARDFTEEELESAIFANGIRILKDEWFYAADDLIVFGREDSSREDRKALSEIPERPADVFVLQIDHSPYVTDDIIESNADLQLSGHTHAGQQFPMQTIYRLSGYDAYGFFRHGNTDVYVSSGAGGWCYPFRTEAGCHYEVITLEPAAGE